MPTLSEHMRSLLSVIGESVLTEADNNYTLEVDGTDIESSNDPNELLHLAKRKYRGQTWSVSDDDTGELMGDWEGDGALLDPNRMQSSFRSGELAHKDRELEKIQTAKEIAGMDEIDAVNHFIDQAQEKGLTDYEEMFEYISQKLQATGHSDSYVADELALINITASLLEPEVEHRLLQDINMNIGLWGVGLDINPYEGLRQSFAHHVIDPDLGFDWWNQEGQEKFEKEYGQSFDDALADAWDDHYADNKPYEIGQRFKLEKGKKIPTRRVMSEPGQNYDAMGGKDARNPWKKS